MGIATAFNSARMLEIENKSVVDGDVVGDDLILRARDNTPINAGNVRGPVGPRGDGGKRWHPSDNYVINDVVGYAGRLWKAKAANTNKPPALFGSLWTPHFGGDFTAWSEDDPYFMSDNLAENYEFFWKSGTASVSLTQVAGEFETGKQALKINIPNASGQRFFQRDENMVRGGEYITVEIRFRKLQAVTGGTFDVTLGHNETGRPEPFEGESYVTLGTSQNLSTSTSWQTLTFSGTLPANVKPRAKITTILTNYGTNNIDVVIDRIQVYRQPAAPVVPVLPPQPGTVISRVQTYAVKLTNVPNNGGLYTAAHWSTGVLIPAGAFNALISMEWSAHAVTNAAIDWYPAVRIRGVGDLPMNGFTKHNESNPALNLGSSLTAIYRMDSYIGNYLELYLNAANAAGSGAWVHMGWLAVNITFTY